MKELSDSDFDRIFRKRVQDFDPAFEESAWELMDKKLRRRDRIVFFRNSSMALTVLFLLGGGIYFYTNNDESPVLVAKQKKIEVRKDHGISIESKNSAKPLSSDESLLRSDNKNDIVLGTAGNIRSEEPLAKVPEENIFVNARPSVDRTEIPETFSVNDFPAAVPAGIQLSQVDLEDLKFETSLDNNPEDKVKDNNPVKFSLTFAAGPDFNSVRSLGGSRPTLNGGVLLNAALTKHFSLSTGLRFGAKNYNASSYNYGNLSPALINAMSGVEGSCNVLEIPLRASYTFINDNKKRISFNSGLSSYLMLKEKYIFSYTPQSGYNDYVLEKVNANQHYFSVVELSASYRFKSKKSKTQFGIEPYVKLPLGGVGEGKVHLKSSGVSLNLFYELSKKNK